MKRALSLLFSLIIGLTTSAQIKRIAILETIDKENKVPYAIEVMVRSNLTKVISNATGYEGYDRVNISQIMDEHDFERSGLVDEEQIKRLGEISGADYILVSEVVKFDESNIFVTAKILNVESAKTESSENTLMGMTAQGIQHGCESLANRLLGIPDQYLLENDNSLLKETDIDDIGNAISKEVLCIDEADFKEIIKLIKKMGFEKDRLSVAKQVVASNHMCVQQIIDICKLFGFESTKLDFAKYAYSNCVEKKDYYLLYEVFSFSSSKRELEKFINNNQELH